MHTGRILPSEVDHAITGRDLEEFRQRFGLTMSQIVEVLSIPRQKINKYIRDADVVIDDVAVALTVRFYLKFPDLLPTPASFDMVAWYESLGGERKVRKRLFSVIFGRDANTSYRWLEKRSPLTKQLYEMVRLVQSVPDGLYQLFALGCTEAEYRDVAPFVTGSWSRPAEGNPATIPFGQLASTPETSRRGPKPASPEKRARAAGRVAAVARTKPKAVAKKAAPTPTAARKKRGA